VMLNCHSTELCKVFKIIDFHEIAPNAPPPSHATCCFAVLEANIW